MTINITSGSSGWGNYVLYGTKDKPRDSDKVQFLEGDIALGDRLSQSNKYEESYYKIVLAFEGKPSDEVINSAYEDFKKEFFVGFDRDEYHIDAVIPLQQQTETTTYNSKKTSLYTTNKRKYITSK